MCRGRAIRDPRQRPERALDELYAYQAAQLVTALVEAPDGDLRV